METFNIILGIIASIFSIISIIISWCNHREIKTLKVKNSNNKIKAIGDANDQIIGDQNKLTRK